MVSGRSKIIDVLNEVKRIALDRCASCVGTSYSSLTLYTGARFPDLASSPHPYPAGFKPHTHTPMQNHVATSRQRQGFTRWQAHHIPDHPWGAGDIPEGDIKGDQIQAKIPGEYREDDPAIAV